MFHLSKKTSLLHIYALYNKRSSQSIQKGLQESLNIQVYSITSNAADAAGAKQCHDLLKSVYITLQW
jgi:hypothetical protein